MMIFHRIIKSRWQLTCRSYTQTTKRPIWNESVPIQLAQCRFPGLAIFNAKIYFSNKIYGNNFIKQHSETVMVWNYQNSHCSLRKNYCVIYYNFRDTFLPNSFVSKTRPLDGSEIIVTRKSSATASVSLLLAAVHTVSQAPSITMIALSFFLSWLDSFTPLLPFFGAADCLRLELRSEVLRWCFFDYNLIWSLIFLSARPYASARTSTSMAM